MSNGLIDYRYLNMDTKQFVSTERELHNQVHSGATKRVIPNVSSNQCLIAIGTKNFSEASAILACRIASGLIPTIRKVGITANIDWDSIRVPT